MSSTEPCIWKHFNDYDLHSYCVIIPSVAVGNVGQLACDLLISSLKMKKVASVYSLALIPVICSDPYNLDSDSMSSCCELYTSSGKKLAILQLRAPLVYKYAKNFLEEIIKEFKERNVKEIIVLASSFAHEHKHVMTSPFRYVISSSCGYKEKLESLKWIEHDSGLSNLKIHGGGFASILFEIAKESDVPCLLLYKYCSEGDNIPDAQIMIRHLNDVVPLFSVDKDFVSQLIQPVSWKLLFGRPPPSEIY